MLEGSESSSAVAARWRTAHSLIESAFCRQLRRGFFETGHSSREAAISNHGSGKSKKRSDAQSYYRELRQVFTRNLPRYFNGHPPIVFKPEDRADLTRTIETVLCKRFICRIDPPARRDTSLLRNVIRWDVVSRMTMDMYAGLLRMP